MPVFGVGKVHRIWTPKGGCVTLWLKFFGSRYQKPGTKDTEVSSDISVDSTVGEGVVCVLVTVLNLVQSPPVTLGTP